MASFPSDSLLERADTWNEGSKNLDGLPDELLLHILSCLDVPELLTLSRVSHRLRNLSFDRVLHSQRLQASSVHLSYLLPHRPPLRTLQPPVAAIYLNRTHVAARRLHFRLLSATLNRSLSRRPTISSLISARILPRECCRRDRSSGQTIIVHSEIFERKRRLELEKFKEGLRVWLERKANEIKKRKSHVGGVGILVWRFSKRVDRPRNSSFDSEQSKSAHSMAGRVTLLRRFWEGARTS